MRDYTLVFILIALKNNFITLEFSEFRYKEITKRRQENQKSHIHTTVVRKTSKSGFSFLGFLVQMNQRNDLQAI